ncbi:hypothetical protein RGQ01_10495 [Akkermansia sp. EB-AMDK43]|uniref:hypothetical protein n=1 Tax=Akkermansia sp. EB-AMDK43 TaxID=3073964 RepID=UPI0028690F3E|nr:hypothetical protein [Akkermansia sp. EB-AMDK43]WMX39545.1 hypothetical protein RGQ01_10495 [Akkermansia sp. EB-AMDK43]
MGKTALKNVINTVQARFQPRVRKAMKRADAVLASVQGVREKMERYHRREALLMSETGCAAPKEKVRRATDGGQFRLLWAGRMIPSKQLALALQTLTHLRDLPELKLHICGGGRGGGATGTLRNGWAWRGNACGTAQSPMKRFNHSCGKATSFSLPASWKQPQPCLWKP